MAGTRHAAGQAEPRTLEAASCKLDVRTRQTEAKQPNKKPRPGSASRQQNPQDICQIVVREARASQSIPGLNPSAAQPRPSAQRCRGGASWPEPGPWDTASERAPLTPHVVPPAKHWGEPCSGGARPLRDPVLVSVQDPGRPTLRKENCPGHTLAREHVPVGRGLGGEGAPRLGKRGNEWEGSWEPAPRQLQGAAQRAAGTRDWRQGRPSREPRGVSAVECLQHPQLGPGGAGAHASRGMVWGGLRPGVLGGLGAARLAPGAGSGITPEPQPLLRSKACLSRGAETARAQRSVCRHVPDNTNKAKHTCVVPAAWLSVQVQGWGGGLR